MNEWMKYAIWKGEEYNVQLGVKEGILISLSLLVSCHRGDGKDWTNILSSATGKSCDSVEAGKFRKR